MRERKAEERWGGQITGGFNDKCCAPHSRADSTFMMNSIPSLSHTFSPDL